MNRYLKCIPIVCFFLFSSSIIHAQQNLARPVYLRDSAWAQLVKMRVNAISRQLFTARFGNQRLIDTVHITTIAIRYNDPAADCFYTEDTFYYEYDSFTVQSKFGVPVCTFSSDSLNTSNALLAWDYLNLSYSDSIKHLQPIKPAKFTFQQVKSILNANDLDFLNQLFLLYYLKLDNNTYPSMDTLCFRHFSGNWERVYEECYGAVLDGRMQLQHCNGKVFNHSDLDTFLVAHYINPDGDPIILISSTDLEAGWIPDTSGAGKLVLIYDDKNYFYPLLKPGERLSAKSELTIRQWKDWINGWAKPNK